MPKRNLIIVGAVVAIAASCVACGITMIPLSNVYQVQAIYHDAPSTDEELTRWLVRQPGVVGHTVRLERIPERKLKLNLIIVQNVLKFPSFPDIESRCVELGYDLDGKFVDVHPRPN